MSNEQRRQRIRAAYEMIVRTGYATCVCGQMFLTEDGYADHVATCTHSQREAATKGEWERG